MEKIRNFIKKYDMVTTEDYIIAGVSGGADSVCLFFVLLKLKSELGTGFAVVHVNHGLRGEAADYDEAFVRQLCKKYDIPLEILQVDLESIAKKRKQSVEEAGRMIRREAFEGACRKYHGTKIALAHHQNDNAETLLWNLARGTGLSGMGGIRPVNGKYIRPLLCMDRNEIERFLQKRNLGFCTDESNMDTAYTRNRLRHQVIPVLQKSVNTQAVLHMNEAMEQIWELQDYMQEKSEEAFEKYAEISWEQSKYCLIRKEIQVEYPDILCRMAVRRAIGLVIGQTQDIGRAHICAVRDLFQKQAGRSLDLPCSVKAVRVYEGIKIYQVQKPADKNPDPVKPGIEGEHTGHDIPQPLCIPGETYLQMEGLIIRCSIFQKTECFSMKEIPEKNYTKWFDYDIIEEPPCIRTRQSGDYITIDQAGHRQKLKSWFINQKIPAGERDNICCIADGSEIMWILGYRMNSAYQVSSHTKQILQIEVVKEEAAFEQQE
ncbi:MAG: tRNA lysidine(34) synthetase TilS [Ruminococcus sp.]|nr:tRNA lysidine(34) synthetase TilS [Ruminococcus sp.]